MDIRDVKPIGTQCVRCHGQANVLIEGWTPDGPTEKGEWPCPRCHAANTLKALKGVKTKFMSCPKMSPAAKPW